MAGMSPTNGQEHADLQGPTINTLHFPLVSLCTEDAERFLGKQFINQHSQTDIISAMEHVALKIELGETLALAWEMVKEELGR